MLCALGFIYNLSEDLPSFEPSSQAEPSNGDASGSATDLLYGSTGWAMLPRAEFEQLLPNPEQPVKNVSEDESESGQGSWKAQLFMALTSGRSGGDTTRR